jgi:DNA-binding HxlR family transcriptional regulator
MEDLTDQPVCEKKVCAKCPCMDACPLGEAMNLIGGKWKVPILCALYQDGPTRYNDLRRKIKGITNTMLASSLKELEGAGLITREQFMEMPIRVEYALTNQCASLLPILQQLARWGLSLLPPQPPAV